MRIITIGREFGSGGRELGKRLADELGIPCYDKEILIEVSNQYGLSPEHIESLTQSNISRIYPTTIGRTLLSPVYYNQEAIQAIASEELVIKKLALRGDCVFVGRSADIILEEFNPFNIFVYANKESKFKRCLERSTIEQNEKELLKSMKKIDYDRASNRKFLTDSEWGNKKSYHLCINTSNIEIKDIIPMLADYTKKWFESQGK